MTRPVHDQVVVITGASSGIGRETALAFGRAGASVVLAARNEAALESAAKEVERLGGRAAVAATDVAVWAQVEKLAQTAVDRFGRVDTWVNNAAVSIYATVEQLTAEEIDRLIQVNLMGQIYGMKAAVPILKQHGGGTIINVASALAERGVPLQAAYCAAKHGIRGFSESLRLELARDGNNIAITVIEPSSINTPLFSHARSKMGVRPQPIPPAYEPRTVADAILFVAEHPRRNVVVGGTGKLMTLGQRLSPRLLDRYMVQGDRMIKGQQTSEPDAGQDNLFTPMAGTGSTTGDFGQGSKSTSAYTQVFGLHPNRERAAIGGSLLAALALVRRLGRDGGH
jgi:NAD(P)-dependent dehydrogenase (short-subunit alcohol dehydrogenase family)